MTTKENPLKKSLLGMQDKPMPQLVAVDTSTTSANQPPSRQGKKVISGYFDPTAARQIKMLSAESDRSVQSLLEEAINDLFRKHGKSSVA